VVAVLRSPVHTLLDRRTALLTITRRRSGHRFNVPVEYCRDGRVLQRGDGMTSAIIASAKPPVSRSVPLAMIK
jgi:hypothetical protein